MLDWFKVKPGTSKAGQLDLTDAKKLGKDAAIVGACAAVAYLVSHIGGLNLGDSTALIVPILTFGLDMVYRWLKDNSPKE